MLDYNECRCHGDKGVYDLRREGGVQRHVVGEVWGLRLSGGATGLRAQMLTTVLFTKVFVFVL